MGIFNGIWAGLAGGLAMMLVTLATRATGFSQLNVPAYTGGLVGGSPRRRKRIGLGIVVAGSLVLGLVYAIFFKIMWGYGSILSAVMLGMSIGLLQWGIFGLIGPSLDKGHPAVTSGDLPPMERFAGGYGGGGALTFLLAHLAFGAVFGWVYSLLSTQ